MGVELIMPQMGESIAEGTIVKWLKKEGDWVNLDEPIVSISTEKVDVEVPSIAAGYLAKILVPEGEKVPIGTVLAIIEEKKEGLEKQPSPEVRVETPEEIRAETKGPAVEVVPPDKELRLKFSPLVRKIAKEEGLKLEELPKTGSGLGGRITKTDIWNFVDEKKRAYAAKIPVEAARPAVSPPSLEVREKPVTPFILKEGEELLPLTPMRKAIAEHMVRSVRTSPHVTSFIEVDMTEIVSFRQKEKDNYLKREGVELTYLPFIILAAIQGVKKYPIVNSSWSDQGIIIKKYVNMGIAVALEDGLIVPVIKRADEKNLRGLAREAHELARKAREKKLVPLDVQGGTFTITNPGVFGTIFGAPIINQPQAAILDIGAIQKRPVVIAGDAIAIRQMMYLSLSFDHRIFDGAMSARFLTEIKHVLEDFNFSSI